MMKQEQRLMICDKTMLGYVAMLVAEEVEKRPLRPSEILNWAIRNNLAKHWSTVDEAVRFLIQIGVLKINQLKIEINKKEWREIIC